MREALDGPVSARRVAILVALAFLLGAGGVALAVGILRGPERSSVDPIELRVEDEPSEDRDNDRKKPRERRRPPERRTRDGRDAGTQAPSSDTGDTTEGFPPAPPAPPVPAGDDDDDGDDGGDDSDDDGDD
jgi:hypothetical protein